jgi:imidazolonepropionase-like amidohydrolase
MPGLIDVHWHAIMTATTLENLMDGESGYAFIKAADEANNTLLPGFTAVRDLGGPTFGLKKAIDEDVIEEGAYAGLLLVDGNPLKNLDVMVD